MSAVQRVLATVELLEGILLHASNADVLCLSRVNKTFLGTINNSISLQRKLFCKSSSPAPLEYNPLLLQTGPAYNDRWLPPPPKPSSAPVPWNELLITHGGKYYQPDRYYNQPTNPSRHIDRNTSEQYILWQLRLIPCPNQTTRKRAIPLNNTSLGEMLLCDPIQNIRIQTWRDDIEREYRCCGGTRQTLRGDDEDVWKKIRYGETVDLIRVDGGTVGEIFEYVKAREEKLQAEAVARKERMAAFSEKWQPRDVERRQRGDLLDISDLLEYEEERARDMVAAERGY